MLFQRYSSIDLNLVSQADWKTYPTASERQAWDLLPQNRRDSLITSGETALSGEWKALLAT